MIGTTDLPYDIDIQLQDGYVRVIATGERRLGDAAADAGLAGRRIAKFCRQHDTYRVLLVLNLTGKLSALDSYEMVVDSSEYGWNHDYRLAMVNPDEQTLEDVGFTETVAVNRGYTLNVFTRESDALEWLLRSGSERPDS